MKINEMGMRIRRMREEKGYTAYQMAEMVGMSQPNFSRWENGIITRVVPERAAAIAKVLGITVEELVGDEDPYTHHSEEVREWLKKTESKEYVLKAYFEYVSQK